VVEEVEGGRATGGEGDITDPSAYSIQDAKLKSEEDQKRRLAEAKKEKVRQQVQELQADFKALVEKNSILPEHLQLREDELLIDPEYAALLEEEGEALVSEVKRECEYESEKAERRLSKLRERYLEPLETELTHLSAFLTGQKVSSFPAPKLAGQFKDLLERVHSAMRSEELQEARNSMDGSSAAGNNGTRASKSKGSLAPGQGQSPGAALAARTQASDQGGGSTSEEAGAPVKQSTFQVRKAMRAARKEVLSNLLQQQPGKNDDDPADVAAIAHAEANMGDYKLKSAEDYEVPQDQAVDPEKKRRQMVLLDENILHIKQQFNIRFEELRSLKLQIVKGLQESNERVREIDGLLGEPVPTNLFEPALDPTEWRHERQLHTEEELEQFREEVRAKGVQSAVPPAQSVIPGLHDSGAQSLADRRPPFVPLGLSTSATAALFAVKRSGVAAEVLPEELQHLPLAEVLGAPEVLSAPASSAGTASAVEKDERQAEQALLRREREELLLKTREHVEAFDEALYELYKERLFLTVDLKAAEVRQSVLHMELGMLRKFEERDQALASKLVKCRGDKEEVVGAVADTQAKLQAKQEELFRCKEVEATIHAEFARTVGTSNAFFPQLTKIFKRKIKRSKKLGDEDLDEDEEESEEEDEDLDEDEDEDEEEEVDDSCPPGCDTQLYETVIEQRSRRLDQEDKLAELQKSIDELTRTVDRHVARQKQIDKDLTQTDREIRSFQTEKQVKLNQLAIPVPLRISQICCFADMGEGGEAEEGGEAAEDGREAPMPTKLVPHAPMGDHVLFSVTGLVGQQRRIEELGEENKAERQNFKELHRNKSKLERAKVQIQAHIDAQQAKCDNLQMLRFGQLIDFEALDKGSAEDQGRLEMEAKVKALEEQGEKEVSTLERRHRGMKETLLHVTQENTGLLSTIADLSSRQYFLEKELNAASGGNVADAGPAVKSEVEERNRLVGLVKLQAKEIDALKAEINLLRRKGGYVYVPTESDVPQIEEGAGQPHSFEDPADLLDPSLGGSSMSYHEGPLAPPQHTPGFGPEVDQEGARFPPI